MSEDSPGLTYDVIVPAFNAEETIAKTLRSLQQQTIPPHRIIVVDDGSTDDTASVASSLSVHVIGQTHSGVSAARSLGLSLVEAPYFASADADDQWLPRLSELQAAWWADASPRTAAIAAAPLLISEVVPHESFVGPSNEQSARQASPIPPKSVWRRNPLTASATFYSTAAVNMVGGYRNFEVADDYDLHLRLLAAGFELRASSTPGIIYLERYESLTSRVAAGLACTSTMLRDFYESPFRREAMPETSLYTRQLFLYTEAFKLALRRGSDLAPLRTPQALALLPAGVRPVAWLATFTASLMSPAFHGFLRVRSAYRSRNRAE